jgi:beta propeller repeat protein
MKTINRIYPIVVALFILLSICATASAEMAPGTETQITSDGANQKHPAIYGDRIVWTDFRNGDGYQKSDIYMYDLSTSTETQITTSGSACMPDIYGDKIVWADVRNGNGDIYMYDLSTSTETQITTNGSWQYWPVIYDDKIVWVDERDADESHGDAYVSTSVYMYNLSTSTETRMSTREGQQQGPSSVYDDNVVWNSYLPDGSQCIYMCNLSTFEETQITTSRSAYSPDIYGDRIVWIDFRNGIGSVDGNIYMYNLSTSTETQITSNVSNKYGAVIYDDRIIWADWNNGDPAICMYDLSTSTETQITDESSLVGGDVGPDIYGNRIVWDDSRNGNSDIYMFTLDSAPELTPLDRTNDLKDYVENTLSGNAGTKKALIRPLDETIHFLEIGRDTKAVSKLKSFITLVEKMSKCKRISADDADYMITEARGIIDQINTP